MVDPGLALAKSLYSSGNSDYPARQDTNFSETCHSIISFHLVSLWIFPRKYSNYLYSVYFCQLLLRMIFVFGSFSGTAMSYRFSLSVSRISLLNGPSVYALGYLHVIIQCLALHQNVFFVAVCRLRRQLFNRRMSVILPDIL